MARLIFISPYLKGGKEASRLAQRTRYIATREGVELLKSGTANQPPTKKQTDFIGRLLRSFPEAKELLEYEDYKTAPTRGTAADLIEQVWEQYVTAQDQRENFLDYVAHRPGVKSDGDHGLWDQNGKVQVLSKAVEEIAQHEGNVWTPVLSIRREDAERLGYTNAESWRTMVNSVRREIADGYKIKADHLRWYAALHEKPNNFHIHMVVFSTDPKEGYLTRQGIRSIKSAFAKKIFRQDLINTYEKKAEYRDTLQRSAAERMEKLIRQIERGIPHSEKLEPLMTELGARLQQVSGRKVYGYLPPQVKRLVDEVVDELTRDERVAAAYALWQDMQDVVCSIYSDTPPERVPLSRQKEFKPVRNMVVREALKLSEHGVTIEEDPGEEPEPEEPVLEWEESAPQTELPTKHTERESRQDENTSAPDNQPDGAPLPKRPKTPQRIYEQADRYRKAKKTLYEDTADSDEKRKAAGELEKLWGEGYEIAAYLLGKVYRDGLGVETDVNRAEQWFLRCAEKGDSYAQYALGKLLQEQGRIENAVMWLGWSADQGNQHAQYRLGKLYLTGEAGKKDAAKAIEYFKAAASQRNQYAQYALGKLYLIGAGISRDEEQAVVYLQQSAEQGNVYAQYLLDHKNDRRALTVGTTVVQLLHSMGDIFRRNAARGAAYRGLRMDRKNWSLLQEKRLAMGHKEDDHEESTQQQQM